MQLRGQRRAPVRPARRGGNGGFPEPPAGSDIRELRRSHRGSGGCGGETRIRLPGTLPEAAVRRVVCDSCQESFEVAPDAAEGSEPPQRRARPGPPTFLRGLASETTLRLEEARFRLEDLAVASGLSRARLWAWAALPLAAIGVLAGLLLLRGSDPAPDSAPVAAPLASGASANARFVEEPEFSLALPAGWEETEPPRGAAFAARSGDGGANATLWIETAPGLSLKQFERRSLVQLGELGDNPRVVDRVDGPTLESSLVELRAEGALEPGLPPADYRVTLRGAGELRHYFASVTEPGSDPRTAAAVELLHSSLRPAVDEEQG